MQSSYKQMSRYCYRTLYVTILILITIHLTACITPKHHILSIESDSVEHNILHLSCAYSFAGVKDVRTASRMVISPAQTYEIDNLVEFLDRRIKGMASMQDGFPELLVELRHTYSEVRDSIGTFSVVMKVGSSPDHTVVIRGMHEEFLWTTSASTLQRGLNGALDATLEDFQEFLTESGQCVSD